MDRQEKVDEAIGLRTKGYSLSVIASLMGITRGHAWSLTTPTRTKHKEFEPRKNTTTYITTSNGGCSTTCEVMSVSMPRLSFLDGPANDNVPLQVAA